MKDYTGKDEDEMISRYVSGLWLTDDKECHSFREDLTLADSTVRGTAIMIEGHMLLKYMELKQYDKIEPAWLLEYKGLLASKYTRQELLEVMQDVIKTQNEKGFTYIEELGLARSIWESFKHY